MPSETLWSRPDATSKQDSTSDNTGQRQEPSFAHELFIPLSEPSVPPALADNKTHE
jgi:hypothetical protein